MTLRCINTLYCEQGAIRAVRFNIDGSYCLTCGADKKIKLWNPYKGTLLKTYEGHGDEVMDAAGSCDSSKIVSGSTDKSVIIWDVATGQATRRLRGHASTVTCVCFNSDSSIAFSGSRDNKICCWDMLSRDNNPIQILPESRDCVTSVKVADYEILAGSLDCHTRRYDMRNGKLVTDFLGDSITCASYTRDSKCVLASCANSTVKLVENLTGILLGEYTGHTSEDYNIESAMSYGDQFIISGSSTGDIYYWDILTGQISCKLIHTPGKVVQSLSAHPINESLLTACTSTVKLWGLEINFLETCAKNLTVL